MMMKSLFTAAILLLGMGSVSANENAAQNGDKARGMELSSDCAACHGDEGKGDSEFPRIAGMDSVSLVKALVDYQSGTLESEFMADYASELSMQDMADLAAYYASLPKD